MKVANTRKVNERIVQFMSREQLNILIGMSLSAPVSVDEIIFEEPAKLESYSSTFRTDMQKNGINYTEDQSLIAAMVMSVIKESIGDPRQIPSAVLDEIFKNGHVFHKGELESNPYYQNIYFDNQKFVYENLLELGIPKENIITNDRCSYDEEFHSYRRDREISG